MITVRMRRSPRAKRCRSAGLSSRATADASSGCTAVMIDTAKSPCGSWKNAYAPRYDERAAGLAVRQDEHDPQRDLVRDHVADRPTGQPEHGLHRGVSQRGYEVEPDPGSPQRRPQHEGHRGDARRRTEPDEQQQPGVVQYALDGDRPRREPREREEQCDDDDVVEHRRERGGGEATARLQQRGRERDQAVEEHLRHEAAQEVGCELALVRDVVARNIDRVQADDQRREQLTDDRDADEGEHRDRDDRAGGFVVAVLEVRDEERNQRRGEHAAEQELVDDVRGLVRVAVDAGEGRHTERVRDRRDAEEARRRVTSAVPTPTTALDRRIRPVSGRRSPGVVSAARLTGSRGRDHCSGAPAAPPPPDVEAPPCREEEHGADHRARCRRC